MDTVDTLVVGAGQAGLALSRHLVAAGHDHVVLERGRVGQRWRDRPRSLSLLTPNWLNRLPGAPEHADEDGFLATGELIGYLERYARSFGAPVLEDVTVLSVREGGGGFRVDTNDTSWQARNVVVATGECELPAVPAFATGVPAGVTQLHTGALGELAEPAPGGVLVVGAGPSGQQIALELARAGRPVTLAVGRHARMPRRYRGRDIWRWLDAIGELDRTIDELPDLAAAKRAPSLSLSGARGGEELGLDVLQASGVRLAGRLRGFTGTHALFDDDLAASLADAEARMRRVLERVDDVAAGAPPADVAPVVAPNGPSSLDLRAGGVSTVIWATGYRRAYPWLHVPVLDAGGEIVQRRGVTPVPGLYAIGLRLLWRRSSHFVGGVGADAAHLAAHIAGAPAVALAA